MLYGSLALTGRGHATDRAIMLGLLGCHTASLDPGEVPLLIGRVEAERLLRLPGGGKVAFDPVTDIVFLKPEMLPRHTNAMRFTASGPGAAFERTYYSVGGGFIVSADEGVADQPHPAGVPYPFCTSGAGHPP